MTTQTAHEEPPPQTPAALPRIAWRSFSAAPHRLFLWGGALYATLVVALWTVQQASLYTPWLAPIAWSVPYGEAHGFMMVYPLLDFYIFGFLLTTFPRWLDRPPVARPLYLAAWAVFSAGAHLFWLGLFLGAGLALVAVLIVLAGHLTVTATLLAILARSEHPGRGQPAAICFGLLMGAAGIALVGVSVATGAPWAWRAARWLGIYAFLLVVVFAVIYRMVPFFTSTVTPGYTLRRSPWAIPLFSAAALARAALGYGGAAPWFWLPDGIMLAVLAHEAVLWRFWRAPMPPLLRVLYHALAWFGISFALSAGESLAVLLGAVAAPPFHNAALHALAVGGFGTLLLGISTRVTLGHSGRGLGTDRLVNTLFWGYQIVPVARVAPEVLGAWVPSLAMQGYWSGVGWVIVFGVWLVAVGHVLLRPRSDGRPG